MQWQGYARLDPDKTEYKDKTSNPKMSQNIMQAVFTFTSHNWKNHQMKQHVLQIKAMGMNVQKKGTEKIKKFSTE